MSGKTKHRPAHSDEWAGQWLASARHLHGTDRQEPSQAIHHELLLWPFSDITAPLPATVAAALSGARGIAALGLGLGANAGRIRLDVSASTRQTSESVSISELHLVGAGSPRFALETPQDQNPGIEQNWKIANGLYSRTVGAIGIETFARLQRSRVAVIGAGGTGSLIASNLARHMGPSGGLLIVDPDTLVR